MSIHPTTTADVLPALTAARARRRARYRRRLLYLSLLLTALVGTGLMVGDTFYTPLDIARVIIGQQVPGASYTVGELRLPRTALAVLAGCAFGVSGVVFQTLLRNQLASPDIIGISSGAGAAGVVSIVFWHLNQAAVSAFSLLAALLVAGVIYLLSIRHGFTGSRLILIGIGVAALLQSVVTYSLSRAAAWDLPTATRWLTGSLNAASWPWVVPVAVSVAVMVPLVIALDHRLGVLRMGDDLAAGLGVPVAATRITVIVAAVALIAVATAACGPVAFVAFMSGPIAMRLVGPAASPVPAAALVGALLMLGADLIGQFALGTRYPVGVITGLIGAPYLILLLICSRRLGSST